MRPKFSTNAPAVMILVNEKMVEVRVITNADESHEQVINYRNVVPKTFANEPRIADSSFALRNLADAELLNSDVIDRLANLSSN